MRYTFLLLFGLMCLGLNTMNAQSCCSKASTAAASVSEKKCDMSKSTASVASTNCTETASTAQVVSSLTVFVSGGVVPTSAKACDPSTCDLTKCDLTKCDPSNCDPSKCPKSGR
ncbi:MAG: hypothetical protein IPO07_21650 [Haliscomenobacter sp.]|nr:hypothetical protein [Haliscomenobacter sp.]MBK9491103.1 hypothetical protein [Haliscomenobacter sp.]